MGLILLAVTATVVGAADLIRKLPFAANQVLSLACGGTVLVCWAALLLLGVAWSSPQRRFTTSFLGALCAIALCLVFIEASGTLWWRFFAAEAWEKYPDEHGFLKQSTGRTCSPAAAAMLLHLHGIRASEGELAYLSGTTLFGTDGFRMRRALERKVAAHQLRASLKQTNYSAMEQENKPFLAHLHGSYGGHAVVVLELQRESVRVLDPAFGKEKVMSGRQFDGEWDDTAILIEGP